MNNQTMVSLILASFLACLPSCATVSLPAVSAKSADQPNAATHTEMRIFKDVWITMRDGVRLQGDVFLPASDGPVPVIVEVTPYQRKAGGGYADEAPFWTHNGYGFLSVDARGQGESEGVFNFFGDIGSDNFDVIEWAARQDWSSGDVGMRGSSYTGLSQWYAAVERPPSLRCIAPSGVAVRPYEELVRNGGAFKLRWAIEWLSGLSDSGTDLTHEELFTGGVFDYQKLLSFRPLSLIDHSLAGRTNPLFQQFISRDSLDDYWRSMSLYQNEFSRIDIPTYSISGWFDGTLVGTSYAYESVRAHSPADDRAFIIIGPWQHSTMTFGGRRGSTGDPVRQVGDYHVPEQGFLPVQDYVLQFYDWCLKGEGEFDQPPAKVYVTGSDVWLDLETYPPQADQTAFYLTATARASLEEPGRLQRRAPGDEVPQHYVYDPAKPVPEYITDEQGKQIRLQSMPVDITSLLGREDILVFETEPLQSAVTVMGNVRLMLHAASSARDTDFTSHLMDVSPDGTALKLGPQSGANARARYRNSLTEAELLTPGEPFEIALDYFAIGHTFQAGHRIRISISSSNYPWISANPNTGNPIASDTAEPVVAYQTIFHDEIRPSRLILPIVDLDALRLNQHHLK